MTSCRISAVIITRNEERRLTDCLQSLSFVDEIVIVDSGSTDKTRSIAEHFNARFEVRPFDHFANQKNYASSLAQGEWLLSIDADERISQGLADEIVEVVRSKDPADGYWLLRENHLFGGPMRFGGNYKDYQLRLVRKNAGTFEGAVHERLKVTGHTARLKNKLLHYSFQTSEEYLKRLDQYTDLEAAQLKRSQYVPTWLDLFIKPAAHFCFFYLFRLGFLDGWRGLRYQFLSSYYLYLKYSKVRKSSS